MISNFYVTNVFRNAHNVKDRPIYSLYPKFVISEIDHQLSHTNRNRLETNE